MQAQNDPSFDERRMSGTGMPGTSPTSAPSGLPNPAVGAGVPLKPQDRPGGGSGEGSGVAHVAGQAAHVAGQVAEKAQQATGQVVDQVRHQANTRLSGQIGHGSDMLRDAAQALTMVGEQLREKDQSMFAGYADQAAERVQRFSGYLQGKDLDAIVDDTERLARNRPGLFLGGAFALGLLAARFLRSSSSHASAGGQRPDYGTTTGYSSAGYGAGYSATGSRPGYIPPASPGYGTTSPSYGTPGSTPGTGYGYSYGSGAGSGVAGGPGYGSGAGTSNAGSSGPSGGQRSAGPTDRPYPSGTTGGSEPEPGYTTPV